MILVFFIQSLLGAILLYLSFHVVFHPVKTRRDKVKIRTFKFLIASCILGSVALGYFQYKDSADKEVKFEIQLDVLQTNLDQIKKTQSSKLQEICSKLSDINSLRQQYEDLLARISTNQSTSPDFRQSIILSDEKFQSLNLKADDIKSWVMAMRGKLRDQQASARIQQEEELKQKQSVYQKLFPCIDHVINYLTNMVGQIEGGEKIELNFNGLTSLSPTINRDDLLKINEIKLSEIKLKNNGGWDFQILWHSPDSTLYIVNEDAHLAINGNGGGELVIPGLPTEDFQFSLADYKQSIDAHLQSLIAYQDYKNSNTNK